MKQLALAGLALIASCFASFASPSTDLAFDLSPPSLVDLVAVDDGASINTGAVALLAMTIAEGETTMQIGHIEGTTRVCGKSQGFLGLPLRDGIRTCSVAGVDVPTMTSAWLPTPDELAALNAGAAIHVQIDGVTPAPMMVGVGPEPDPV